MNESTSTSEVTLEGRYDCNASIVLCPNYEYIEKSALDLNFDLRRLDRDRSTINTQTSNIDSVKDYLIENYSDLQTHADEIATLLDIELVREVQYSVSMSATVTVMVGCEENAENLIHESLFIESHRAEVVVDGYEVESAYEA